MRLPIVWSDGSSRGAGLVPRISTTLLHHYQSWGIGVRLSCQENLLPEGQRVSSRWSQDHRNQSQKSFGTLKGVQDELSTPSGCAADKALLTGGLRPPATNLQPYGLQLLLI